jgi:histone H3/H4
MVTARKTASAKAGLILSVSRVEKQIRKIGGEKCRVSKSAGVYLASILESLVVEISELSANEARARKCKRLVPRHIMYAIETDASLKQCVNGVIANSGIVPNFAVQIPRKQQSTKNNEKQKESRQKKVNKKEKGT